MNKPNSEPEQIMLKDLPKDYYRLSFITKQKSEMLKKEERISIQAGELVGKLYDAIRIQYKEPDSVETLKNLNMLCVRLVFCLYAEDAGIFGTHEMFGQYLAKFPASEVRKKLIELFEVLDTKREDRDPYMDDDLAAFPYVNGGLFAEKNIEIPRFNEEIVDILINKASAGFDWADISPTIFGAVFESTLNPETRRSGGMHYTSIENIHKVIDPLFLNDLTAELETILDVKQINVRTRKLEEFRNKLASLTFLDPACGSGNFLTQTYLNLRQLENKALKEIIKGETRMEGQTTMSAVNPVKMSIGQFYGIEINDFAVSVAKTALWIAESQMLHETEIIMEQSLDFLPLKSYANIIEGNALRIDWEDVVPKDKLTYIISNPPFVGARQKKEESEQKQDLKMIFKDIKKSGNLDYVSCWYKKSSELMIGTSIKTALVSTNSITQGEQVDILWNELFKNKVHIDFAYRTFVWNSEAVLKAHVHCVIIGFSTADNPKDKMIYEGETVKKVKHINPYLIEAEDILIKSRTKPLCNSKQIRYGNLCGNTENFIISEDEKKTILEKEPSLSRFIKPYIGADEYIKGKIRYCFWLVDASPKDINSSNELKRRVKNIKDYRSDPDKPEATRRKADVPHLFFSISQPSNNYIIIPRTSSENRVYIPIGFMSPDFIASDATSIIPDADLYDFGILTSSVHMAWMRTVCGRLKSDYRYSKDIVYNNFPWCSSTAEQKAKIEQTAQAILDARALYPDCSLADLYDETTMPPELRKAHQANDKAVMQAYGFDYKTMTESECVAELMKMYQKLTEG